ncbi:MAG: ABC transporter ATP-binding protein [Oscillatoriales cyanobacterium]|nr:MAG: ABC transporter ATP-binding protein [Oscillatoriales cyanobacterium]
MLRIERLVKTYGDRPVLRGLSLSLRPGEIYGLLGPNGAGKSTTINILGRLLEPDSGAVWLADRPLARAPRQWLGIAPQDNLLYKSLTCAENLDFFASLYGLGRADRARQVAACLAAVGLSDRAHSPVETLSGGMQRRLNVAIALVHRPKLVILDEPTAGLDLEARYELWATIRSLKQLGMTVLLTTHLLDEAERLCDRLGILHQGTIAAEGTMDELRSRIPAVELVRVTTTDPAGAIARAESLGWDWREVGGELVLRLPESLSLPALLDRLADLPIDGLARQPVNLEAVYWDVTREAAQPKG